MPADLRPPKAAWTEAHIQDLEDKVLQPLSIDCLFAQNAKPSRENWAKAKTMLTRCRAEIERIREEARNDKEPKTP